MSELTDYYREVACGGAWMAKEAAECGCGGSGWWLSDVDTWHSCRIHNTGQQHPEDPAPEGE